jgi:hypothetical protein
LTLWLRSSSEVPANTAPETIVGPFASVREAEEWAEQHPRAGGYCVAQELTAVEEVSSEG